MNWSHISRTGRINLALTAAAIGVVVIVIVANYRRTLSANGNTSKQWTFNAAEMLANSAPRKSYLEHLETQLREFIDHLHSKYEFNPKIVRMKERMRDTKFVESAAATFTQNKGEVISLCLKDGADLFDHNTLMFVLLHEAAHMYSSSVGHGPEFWRNFRFLLVEASKLGIYTPVDYSKTPVKYCGGKMISDSPLFNWDSLNQIHLGP